MKLFQKLINLVKKFGINANKIELSANDILNLLAGNEINLSSKKIKINSDSLKINPDGTMLLTGSEEQKKSNIKIEMFQNSGRYLNLNPAWVILENGDTGNETYLANLANGCWFRQISGNSVISIINDGDSFVMMELKNGISETKIEPDKITTPTLTQTSLAEQKKNFEKMQDRAVDILKNIDIYKYNLKCEKDTDKKHIGFVIGDKYNYSKEVTSLDNKGVDNYSFTSLCCKAIQELSQQVESLQNEIKILKEEKFNEINRLDK